MDQEVPMSTHSKDDAGSGTASLIFAIAALMSGDAPAVAEATLVRTIQREADLDLDGDQILHAVWDTGVACGDPELALRRLHFLNNAGRNPMSTPRRDDSPS
jgi:hypothetical protein